MLPLSITIGVLGYRYFSELNFLTPYLLALMLFFTFCKINPKEMKVKPWHWWLLAIQVFGSIAIYAVFAPFNKIIAQGLMICVIAPTANAAAVITGKLGGSIESLTTYTLLSNLAVAIVVPVFFPMIAEGEHPDFISGFLTIASRVFPLLIGPFLLAMLMHAIGGKTLALLQKPKDIAFYLWSVALVIVTARTVKSFVENDFEGWMAWSIIIGSLLLTLSQFAIGKYVGKHYGDRISAGQALGQKNNILSIWMAQTYLGTSGLIAAIGPGMCVLWQNIVNSYQLWRVAHNKPI